MGQLQIPTEGLGLLLCCTRDTPFTGDHALSRLGRIGSSNKLYLRGFTLCRPHVDGRYHSMDIMALEGARQFWDIGIVNGDDGGSYIQG